MSNETFTHYLHSTVWITYLYFHSEIVLPESNLGTVLFSDLYIRAYPV